VNFDISRLLKAWEFNPTQPMVRRFKGTDGAEKIQLRLDLGLLQMNTCGRPDGKRPFNHESLLDHYQTELARHVRTHEGSDEGFALKAEDCAQLQLEAIQYHHRYLCLFQLGDFAGVIRDTDRNLEVFDFLHRYAEDDEAVWGLQHLRPQLMMIRTRALGNQLLKDGRLVRAAKQVETGIAEIRKFIRENDLSDLGEGCEEIDTLEAWLKEIQTQRPLSRREKLEKAMREAVQREDYEKAAHLRDALRNLKTPSRRT
jgi:hypothetical protein